MLTATEFVQKYIVCEPQKKFEMMFNNYDQFDSILDLYREDIIYKIICEIEYQYSVEKNKIDIRVQHSVGFSDTVFSQINLHEQVERLIDSEIYEARFDAYLYYNQMLICEVKNYIQTRREMNTFRRHIYELRESERRFMLEVLIEGKKYDVIGNKIGIESESVRKKMQRLKGKLKGGIIEALNNRHNS